MRILNFIKSVLSSIKCQMCGIKYTKGTTIAYSAILKGKGIEMSARVHISRHASVLCESGSKVLLNENIRLQPDSKIQALCGSTIHIQKNTMLYPDSLIYAHRNSEIIFGEGSMLSKYSSISSENSVSIGNNVLMGPNVFIADYNHEYRDITKPISQQGHISRDKEGQPNRINIEDGCWIGKNAVVVGNVHIGRNSVIGANSTVVKDIPAYCVAAGSPAKVLKRFDFTSGQWIRVNQNC